MNNQYSLTVRKCPLIKCYLEQFFKIQFETSSNYEKVYSYCSIIVCLVFVLRLHEMINILQLVLKQKYEKLGPLLFGKMLDLVQISIFPVGTHQLVVMDILCSEVFHKTTGMNLRKHLFSEEERVGCSITQLVILGYVGLDLN